MNDLAKQNAIADIDSEGKSALATLPPDWIKPVGFFCLAHLGLIRTRGPLVANLKLWIKKGLTLDDARKIMERLLDPEIAQHFHFENQLMAEFRASVARVFRMRKIQREAAIRREADAAPAGPEGQILSFAESANKRLQDALDAGKTKPPPLLKKGRRA